MESPFKMDDLGYPHFNLHMGIGKPCASRKDPEAIQHGSFDIQWSITYLKIATRPGFHGYISMFDG
jgi:hypothetical protein